jgi:hypothetical protein
MQITLKIKWDNKDHNKALLQAMGFPFTK